MAGSIDLLALLAEAGWDTSPAASEGITAHLAAVGPKAREKGAEADSNGELVVGKETPWVPPSEVVLGMVRAAHAYLFAGTGLCLSADAGKGKFYAYRFMLRNVFDEPAGMLEIGGTLTQRTGGRPSLRFELTGMGCGLIEERGDPSADHAERWCALQAKLARVGPLLSRVDVAFDDFDGKRNRDMARCMWELGEFDYRFAGDMKRPQAKAFDDCGSGKGSTFYVGNSSSEKQLRVYEKGKQLGDPDSPWTRWELQLRGSTRKRLTLDVLTDPLAYMRGAFECLDFVSSCIARLEVTAEARKACVKSVLRHAKRMYGATFWQLVRLAPDRESVDQLLRFLEVEKPPRWAKTGRASWGDVAGLLEAPAQTETEQ